MAAGRGQHHGVAADGQLPAGLRADVSVPLSRRHGGVPHGTEPVRGVARGRLGETVDQRLFRKRRHRPLRELKRRVLHPAAGIARRVPVDETALQVGGVAADSRQAQPGGVKHPVVPAALQQHRVIRRGLVEFGGGGQAALREAQFVPVGGGPNPLAGGVCAARSLIRRTIPGMSAACETGTPRMFCAASMRWLWVSTKAGSTTSSGSSITTVPGPRQAASRSPRSSGPADAAIMPSRMASAATGAAPAAIACTVPGATMRSAVSLLTCPPLIVSAFG